MFFHYIFLAPIEFFILGYMLYRELGLSAFAGMGVMVLLTPIQMLFGNVVKRFRFVLFEIKSKKHCYL